MQEKRSPTAITTNDRITYYLMTEEDVLEEIRKTTNEVNEILGLPSTTLVRLILNYFQWDKGALTERYYEDPDRLFQELNVANPHLSPSLQWNPLSPAVVPQSQPLLAPTDPSNKTCRTCHSEYPADQIYAFPCRHQHCLSCCKNYLESSIALNGCTQSISCPSRCIQVIDDEEILKLLDTNDQLRQRYQRLLVDAFVQTNRLTRWCPGTDCRIIIKTNKFKPKCAQMIECDQCQMASCFQCGRPWHEPVQCSILEKWEKKNQDESMTGKWIIANTKECPGCHSSIEKDGGCNHMTCRKTGCGHEFCWLCFGDWKEHAQRPCNVLRQEEIDQAQSNAREVLNRYIHYYTRYQTHQQSLDLEKKLREQVEERKKEMQRESRSYTEQQAPGNALKVLQQCRRTLKYTYPFAFYLERTGQSEIFEANQADLERATETLSGFLEHEIDFEKNFATDLMNKTSYCNKRRQTLLDHCKDGYARSYWVGLDPYETIQ